ncbi:DcrB-related protein [Spirulina sp. CS-785/01]|uniref:DcrB-related protein n=1 Tax=Spirulina sp. CS-785/01 TaxID=3021716 RepID=UPI00233088C4|nr:DcrB-related protein [Spirulina sp. CS-785/01]MDB9313341.1 DcrB-related protein [Spirulina sp. CS-785/01]
MIRTFQGLLLLSFCLISVWGCNAETKPQNQATASSTTATENEVQSTLEVEPNPNFASLEGKGITLDLPKGFEGGDPRDDIEDIAQNLEGAGEKYQNLSEALRASQKSVQLIAFDTENSQSGFVTNVNVTQQPLPEDVEFDQLMDGVVSHLQELGYEIEEQNAIAIHDQTTGQLVVNIQAGETQISQLVYAIPNQDEFWLVTYSTPSNEFEQRREDFEQSIVTFSPLEP